jgi:hypothetical protein
MVYRASVGAIELLNSSVSKISLQTLRHMGEWVVYDPFAKLLSNQFGQITVEGVGKVNASKPGRSGEFEWFDLRDCADYMALPKRLAMIEQQQCDMQKQLNTVTGSIDETKKPT